MSAAVHPAAHPAAEVADRESSAKAAAAPPAKRSLSNPLHLDINSLNPYYNPPCLLRAGLGAAVLYCFLLTMFDKPMNMYLATFLKPLPVLMCAGYCFLTARFSKAAHSARISKLVGMGLVLAAFGDVALIYERRWREFFIPALVLFLGQHILNLKALSTYAQNQRINISSPWIVIFGLPLYYVYSMCVNDRMPNSLKLPTLVYMFVLTSAMWRSVARVGTYAENKTAHLFMAIGYVIFAVSDSTIALDMFARGVTYKHDSLLIMLTYYAAQFLFALSQPFDRIPAIVPPVAKRAE